MPRGQASSVSTHERPRVDAAVVSDKDNGRHRRSAYLLLGLLIVFLHGSWSVYRMQFANLPLPLDAEQAGKRGFSEASALKHVKYLTGLGPHPVGSDSLDLAVQYVYAEAEKIKKAAHPDVDVQLELFHTDIGANRLAGGLFKGKTILYSDLKHVILRFVPKYLPEAEENLILVSSHIDTVFTTGGAGDCSSCVGVMLELARGVAQWAHGFKSGVLFLFNTGEEEGLVGAHSFITQHHWRNSVRFAVDLEAMGIGGKSTLFQGTHQWALESFATVAKYPSAQIAIQDIFNSGATNSATDFQIYLEVAGLPGLDFAYTDMTSVYHTKNDKMEHLKPGSLQHNGENMLAFLLHAASSQKFMEDAHEAKQESVEQKKAIFFDILGKYMVVYPQRLATMFHNSIIFHSLLILGTSLLMGKCSVLVSLGISCLSIILTLIFSIFLSVVVAFAVPHICPFPISFVANPWLVIGLFGSPALLGAFIGQHIGFILLKKHIEQVYSRTKPGLTGNKMDHIVGLEAERWIFKSGFLQWLIVLILGTYFKVGASYIALIWLVSPAFAYGLMEATLSPLRSPKHLKVVTLVLALAVPVVSSAGLVIRLVDVMVGTIVRADRNPGGLPGWFGNVVVAVAIALVVSFMFVYLLSYVHISGAKRALLSVLCASFGLAIVLVSSGIVPAFTEDISRTVNVVHVVDTTRMNDGSTEPLSYVSLFSHTPGKLTQELMELRGEEFSCGRNMTIDFATFTMMYGCRSYKWSNIGWSKSEVPMLHVESDSSTDDARRTIVSIDTKSSTRWSLAINKQEIDDFTIHVDSNKLVHLGGKSEVDGWHTIRFAGGKSSPTKFELTLFWSINGTHASAKETKAEDFSPLVKLRTDVNRVTPMVAMVLEKLPRWSTHFGKSTFPYTLAFLTTLPINI
ncbi:endoplasmic reticulum metallopeptidase 1-like [Triticum dicoccoides]|uniref:endoplasmic reticulum metallopeptidase 1-like n=1 Tax=Triticum dicoccoides TaxID=85692 RepID=UPI000E79D6CE|nr:endoplasmic reticulum metallopeptidase 1-like [Triticum dicoccoides]XP_037480022.1 endoplasmic reticulum metallopeptidase 1-like [Triticum dicoccoides]